MKYNVFTNSIENLKCMSNKITLLSTLCFLLFTGLVNAQKPPNAFNYSAVARNVSGQPIANTVIGIQITILKTTPSGVSQYSENHFVNTDAFGLFNLVIGAGALQSGSMATIDWSNDNYYLKVGMDATGGTNFLTMGTTQLLSVPYAMYAKSAGSVSGGLVMPTVTTNVTAITSNSATFGGAISNANGNQIVERGIVYSTSPNPYLGSNKIMIGIGIGSFDTITSMSYTYQHFLLPNTQYYVRAYALTENNISVYGNEVPFTTLGLTPPTITTNVTAITSNSATFGGAISNANGNKVVQRGIVYSTSPNPTLGSNKIIFGNGISTFDTILAFSYGYTHFFNPNTTYYVRAYAFTENNISTYYGNEVSFKTLSVGQTGPGGGIVFFDKGNANGGWQYLESATSDQSTGIAWGCDATSIPGTQLTVGSGEANTTLIVAGCNEASFAAKLCDNLSLGGQSDWFLPSRDELYLMYKNLHQNGQGNFGISAYYLSSTEAAAYYVAWIFGFGNENANDGGKFIPYYVRAIRAF